MDNLYYKITTFKFTLFNSSQTMPIIWILKNYYELKYYSQIFIIAQNKFKGK